MKTVLRIIGVNLAVFLGLCLLAEAGLRARQGMKYGVWRVPYRLKMSEVSEAGQFHPFLRTVPKAGTHGVWDADEKVVLEHNSLGFRSDEISFEKPPNTFRIVCVGGSTAYDTQVRRDEAWPTRLQDFLRKRFPNPRIEVVNAGLPGRTSADNLINLGLRLLPLKPDVILFYEGLNDPKPNAVPGFWPDYSHYYSPPDSISVVLFHRLINRSLLLSHIRYRIRPLLNPWLRDNPRGLPVPRTDKVSEAGPNTYRRNLQSMIAMAHRQGSKIMVAATVRSVKPNPMDPDPDGKNGYLLRLYTGLTLDGIEKALAAYNQVNREVAQSDADCLVDLESVVPASAEYFTDGLHFTPKGSELVARTLADSACWENWIRKESQR